MKPSLDHFKTTARLILRNSWFAGEVLTGKQKFTFSLDVEKGCSISFVPEEPFESLLVNVRRLTMPRSPENLSSISKELKKVASAEDRTLLELWKRCWQLALIKEPFIAESRSGRRHIVTPFRAYHSFINGKYFHTGDDALSHLLFGDASGAENPSLFLQNIFHSAVCSFASAAIGLHDYLENGSTFHGIRTDRPDRAEVFEFLRLRGHTDKVTEQVRIFSEWIEQNGKGEHCRWD